MITCACEVKEGRGQCPLSVLSLYCKQAMTSVVPTRGMAYDLSFGWSGFCCNSDVQAILLSPSFVNGTNSTKSTPIMTHVHYFLFPDHTTCIAIVDSHCPPVLHHLQLQYSPLHCAIRGILSDFTMFDLIKRITRRKTFTSRKKLHITAWSISLKQHQFVQDEWTNKTPSLTVVGMS